VQILASRGAPEAIQRAILGHATYTGVPRETLLARALFAADELSGFLVACAMVRPNRSLAELEAPSVRKKLKDKAFARGVSREDVFLGAEELGVPLDELITMLIAALRPHERLLGLGAA
jgi:predicted hydrolase (HD superfamily)